jgi:transcriptional regulator with XRE-family HTH domain
VTTAAPRAHLRSVDLLRGYIHLSGLTYRELAEKAGVAHATLANLARPSGRTSCSSEVAERLAGALEVDTALLFLSDVCTTDDDAPI